MIRYDILYVCPSCESEHTIMEWNTATREKFGEPILSLGLANEPSYEYTCPTCSHISSYEEIKEAMV